jgi:hypothetical protein
MNAALSPRWRLPSPVGFGIAALLIWSIDGWIMRSPAVDASPDVITAAVTFDLTLGLTFFYWLFVVRRGHARLRTTVWVFLASIFAAPVVLPIDRLQYLAYLKYSPIALEIALPVILIDALRRRRRRSAADVALLDIPERVRDALESIVPSRAVAAIVATEIAMLYYALASWRRKPFVPPGAQGFSYHKRSAFASALYALALVSFVEMVAVHVLIASRIPVAAAVILAITALGTLWILGFARSVQLRPTLVTRDEIRVRTGMQWELVIPRAQIERIDAGRPELPEKGTKGYFRNVPGQPNVLVTLREPLTARNAYGMSKRVTVVGLVVDDLTAFRRATSSDTPGSR